MGKLLEALSIAATTCWSENRLFSFGWTISNSPLRRAGTTSLPENICTKEIKSSRRLNEVEPVSPVARDGVIFRVNFDTEESQRRNTNVAISFLALNQFVCPVLWLSFSSFL